MFLQFAVWMSVLVVLCAAVGYFRPRAVHAAWIGNGLVAACLIADMVT